MAFDLHTQNAVSTAHAGASSGTIALPLAGEVKGPLQLGNVDGTLTGEPGCFPRGLM